MDCPSPIKASRREWIGLAVIAVPCLLYAMDITVLNLAIPAITAELRPSSAQLLWLVDIYGFLLAGLLITMGTLGDRIGRRRLLMIGAAAFGAASVLAALSTNVVTLITARALLGMAAAAFAPSTLSLIRHMFVDAGQRTFAIGVWSAMHAVGAAAGPLIGGTLLEHFHWGSVFLIAVPFVVLLLMLGPKFLPEFRNPQPAPIDVVSAVHSIAAVLSIIYGIKHIAEPGWSAPVAIATGTMLAIAFVRRQYRLAHPLIDPRLLRDAAFSVALLAYTLGCFVSVGILLFTTQYLQLMLGLPPLQAGLWTLPATLGYLVGSSITPAITRRLSPAHTMSAGLILAAIGVAVIGQATAIPHSATLGAGLLILTLGLAPVFIPAINIMVSSVPAERAGEASALSETGSEFGSALGIAILGSIGTAIYRGTVAPALPAGLSLEDAVASRETLGAAVAIAEQLPEQMGTAVLEAARTAFDQSLYAVSLVSAAVLVAVALAALVLSRSRLSAALEAHRDCP